MNHSRLVAAAAILGFLGVALGAFGTHALELAEPALGRWQTGSHYHLVHALAALVAAMLGARKSGWLFVVGTAIFSGSLYLMAVTGKTWLGAITPLGGVCYLVGWAMLALHAMKTKAA